MKFSNGCWLQKEGVECFSPQEVYYSKVKERKVTLCAPTYRVANRGCTLGGINLTITVTSPMPGVLRVQTAHFLGEDRKSPEFELNLGGGEILEVEDSDGRISITSGSLTLDIDKLPFCMTYRSGDRIITKSSGKDLALIKTDRRGLPYDRGDSKDTYIRQQLSIGVGELIYGLGERFTPFAKNGQSVEIWNADGGTSTEQSYKNIPFFISNKGYGVLVNHPERVEFEIGTETVTKTEFSVPSGYLDYFLFDGPSMKDVLVKYTDLSGKPALPAPWTFGLWLSTSFTTNYDEATVMSFADGMLERGIPLRTFHFDAFWMKEFHWCDFVWDDRIFPDAKGMLRRMKEKGLNICVWINPYVGQEASIFKEGCERGYFIKRKNGDVWQWDMWQPGMAIVDFTNPFARTWFQDKLEALLDMGVDCFKTDFGERIPTEDVMYFDGSDPVKMHNYYTYIYNKTVYELLVRKRGRDEAVLFARSATVGGQKFPVHWGGDCWSDYESMEESLRGGLSLCMSGFGFWSHDIGGFEHTSTPDVYKRWAAFGLLSTHSRLHGSQSYRVPWVYDEEAVDVVRKFTRLKSALMPYLYRNAIYTSQTGIPMMRSMVLEFPEERGAAYLDKQYMLGDSLLVAPIFNDRGEASFYLPEGIWTDFLTGRVYEGGKWYAETVDYLHIPLLARENSIIAVNPDAFGPEYDYSENLVFCVMGLTDTAETTVYAMDKAPVASLRAVRTQNTVNLTIDTKKPCKVRLCGLADEIEIAGSMTYTVTV
ncbi:MAG: alpha-xylosidase [Butyrivibrio sp.]|nr:alpha-xylosidase [Butyrivibrio sp.]